jgi:bifunctional DNA primase/polymerase-like protein
MSAQPNFAKAAVWYATQKSLPVFPLIPRDKRPLTEHGLKDATTDPAIISKWWADQPEANIGLAMGDGLFAVDIDGEAGAASLASLEATHGRLPGTVEAVTSNGRHLLFKLPSGVEIRNSASKIGEGIDVRGTGGYLVVAPSIHPSGARYQWKGGNRPDQIDAADAPAWLIELVRRREPAPVSATGLSDGNGRIDAYASAALANELAAMACAREGRRNHQLNEAAFKLGTLVGAGMIERGTVEAALAGAAAAAGLDQIETERTIKSGIESGIQQPREVPERQPNEPLHGLRIGGSTAPQPGLNSSNSFNSYQHSSEWPELPDEARHGFVGRLLDVVGPHTEADPVAIIGQMLAGFGAAIGRMPHFAVERDRHGGNIFLVLVGETSKGRKGTSLGYARELIVTADPTLCDRMANGLSSGEGLIDAVRDPIEKQQAVKDGKKTIGFER